MSLPEYPSTVHSSALRLDELENAFRAWVHDPAKPDVVDLGQHGEVPMVELSRRLGESQATLAPSACAMIGLPPSVTIATATAELLHATIDPDGPRCRSFRSASSYLRGLARLEADLRTINRYLNSSAEDETREFTPMSASRIDDQSPLPAFDVDRPIEAVRVGNASPHVVGGQLPRSSMSERRC